MGKENRIRKNAACSFAVFVFPLVALLCVSCQSPAGGDVITPVVNSVTIADYPAIKWLVPGETAKFLATVDAQGGADDTVKWEVTAPSPSAGKHHGTAINSPSGNKIGELSVDRNEEAVSLTVTATSVADETKSASKIFSVLDFKGVEIRPWEFDRLKVAQGKSFTFSAINDSEETITDKAVWTVEGSHSPSTGIDRGVFTCDFLGAMRAAGVGNYSFTVTAGGKGAYTFTVTAVGTGTYSDSSVSEESYPKYHFNLTPQSDAGTKFGTNSVKSIAYGNGTYWSVVWGDGRFVAVGDDGYISTSHDGKEWTAIKQNFTTEGITALASDGTRFLLGGYNGASSKFAFSD